MYQKGEPWFQEKLWEKALPGNTTEKKGPESQLLQEAVKAPRLHVCWKHRLHGKKPPSLVLSASLPQGSDPCPPGPHPSPSLWTVWSADLSRWPRRPPCVCSRAAPSPRKGTSTRGTHFLCSSGRPARWALIPPQSELTSWHWGLVHSPTACTPRGHLPGPSCHHRWCPRSPGQVSPLSRHRDLLHPPGGAACCLRREKGDNGVVTLGVDGVLDWRIPGTGESGGLPSMGSHRVRHNWSDLAPVASSVLWDSHLSSRGRSPLRPQSLLVQTRSRCIGAAPGSGFLQKQQWSGVW